MGRAVRQVLTVLVALTLGGVWAAAEEKKKDKEGPLDPKEFVKKAGYINYEEIAAGQIAAQRGSKPEVRQYGERLARDHRMANQELVQLAVKAKKDEFILAGAPDEKTRALAAKLSQLSGAEFDKEFLHRMIMGHKKAIQMFEAEANHGKNAAVKAFAEKTLPTLREHLKEAQKLSGEEGKEKEK